MTSSEDEAMTTTTGPTHEAVEALARIIYRTSFGRDIDADDALYESILVGRREAAKHIARAVLAAGYVSPEEHHETLNDYGKAVGDLNDANHRLAQIKVLADGWLDMVRELRAALNPESGS